MVPGQEANNDNLRICFDFLQNNCMLNEYTTYNFMI